MNAVLEVFTATWCIPCLRYKKFFAELPSRFALEVRTYDIESQPERAQRACVQSVPTVRLFVDGELVEHLSSGVTRPAIIEMLRRHNVGA